MHWELGKMCKIMMKKALKHLQSIPKCGMNKNDEMLYSHKVAHFDNELLHGLG